MNDVFQHLSREKPIIYFCGYGFEQRSTALLPLLRNRCRVAYGFSIGFPSTFLGQSLNWKTNKSFIDDSMSCISDDFNVVNTSVQQPIQIIQRLRETFSHKKIDISQYQVLVDITSFPKPTLLMLLLELTRLNAEGLLFYVEPEDYELPISIGVKDVRTLPLFGEDYDPKKQKFLLVILGFEGLRAHALWETFDPHRTMALIGVPFDGHGTWTGIPERENRLILSRPNVDQQTVSFTSIEATLKTLEEVYGRIGNKYNVVASTLGSKLTAVALFYFAMRHKNVFIAYSRPEQHTEHCSYGFSNLIIARFNKDEASVVSTIQLTKTLPESVSV
jgi:hypothetical protein